MPEEDALKAAKVRLHDAQAAKAEAEARHATANAEATEHNLAIGRKELEELYATDAYHNVYRLVGAVDSKSVESAMRTLSIWRRTKPHQPITLILQSPGGSVIDGLALWDFLQELRQEHGIHLTTIARGYAASMAGILLQAGDVRVAGKESWILIHEVSAGAMGSWGELTDRMDWLEKVQDRILDIFADRAKASAAEKPITKNQLKKNWTRKDWWISSDEALKLGIVDEVR